MKIQTKLNLADSRKWLIENVGSELEVNDQKFPTYHGKGWEVEYNLHINPPGDFHIGTSACIAGMDIEIGSTVTIQDHKLGTLFALKFGI